MVVSPHPVAFIHWSSYAFVHIGIVRMIVEHVSPSVHREPIILNTPKSTLLANWQIFFNLNAIELLQQINLCF